MHKLNLTTGGHERSLNDLDTLQNQSLDILKGMSAALTDDPMAHGNFVLYGAGTYDIPGAAIGWNAGTILWDNEVFILTAGQGVYDEWANGVYMRKRYTAQANNPVTYADGSTHDVHVVGDIFVFTVGGVPGGLLPVSTVLPGDVPFGTFKPVEQYLAAKLRNSLVGGWKNIALSTVGNVITGNIGYKLDGLNRVVHLNGTFQVNNATTVSDPPINFQVATLPPEIVPARGQYFSAGVRYHGGFIAGAPAAMPAITRLHVEIASGSGTYNFLGITPIRAATASSYTATITGCYHLD